MGFFSSSTKYREIWAWEGPPETPSANRDSRAAQLASKFGIGRSSVKFFSHSYAISQSRKMHDLRGPTPLPHYDDVITQEAAWEVVANGGAVVWHEKGDPDDDWPKHNFMKFTKI